jgi:predicted RNA-binding protein YlqC (UPF0109 family)
MENTEMTNRLRDLLTQIVTRLVDNPDQVEIAANVGATTLVFEIAVVKQDLGKIIGKRGHTIAAIRTIMMSVAGKIGKRVYVEVKE